MIEFQEVKKSYGSHEVLRNLNLEANRGEIFGLLAANGAGKTTAMRIAMGLIPLDSGRVVVEGREIAPGDVQGVGYMPEERGLYGEDRVVDQLMYLARLHGLSLETASANVDKLLGLLDLEKHRKNRIKKLSLGNQQRVQIAAALIHMPSVLILDEPFSGLDPFAVEKLASFISDYAKDGATVMFSSHQIDVVEMISDKIGLLQDGKLEFTGSLAEMREVYGTPQVDLTVKFLEGRSFDDLDWDHCPSVTGARYSPERNVITLQLNQPSIAMGEVQRSGIKSEEIIAMKQPETSLRDALVTLYKNNERNEA